MAKPDGNTSLISVEVAYALPERQLIVALQVERGCMALQAVKLSGIAREFPEITPDTADMGIFSRSLDGKVLPLPNEYVLQSGDRVEIYRPLLADPKVTRLQRASRVRNNKN